jgi:hypothetical protein
MRSEVENDARNERDRRLGEICFFDDAVEVSQVIAKCVTGVGCSLLEVTGEVQLCAQRASGLDCFRLLPLPCPNLRAVASNSSTFFRPGENAAVVICENDITRLPFDPARPGRKVLQSKRLFPMNMHKSLYFGKKMVRDTGFEPVTPTVSR